MLTSINQTIVAVITFAIGAAAFSFEDSELNIALFARHFRSILVALHAAYTPRHHVLKDNK